MNIILIFLLDMEIILNFSSGLYCEMIVQNDMNESESKIIKKEWMN